MALIADRYRLRHVVGRGGMGVVWEAWDERLERRVALKQLHRQSRASTAEAELANKRAMREARLTARLNHPHAVPVFDVVEQEGQLWLIMQFIPSITLADVLKAGGPLQPQEAAQVGAEVGSALAAAHAVGIVHRDVKPGNILIADDGTALISDFGIAHALGDATLTTRGLVHGTPAYLAPEVARGGEADFASDVFSLGATLYSALEGTPPFGTDENSIALLHRVASGEFPQPQRSGALTPVILEMLVSDPEARPSMKKVAVRLTQLATGTPSDASGATLPPPGSGERTSADAGVLGSSKTHPVTPSARDSISTAVPDYSDQRQPESPRRRGIAAAVAVVALLAIGILVTALLMGDRIGRPTAGSDQSSSAAPRSTSPSTAPHSATPKASSTPRREPSPTATARTSARTASTPSSPTTAPTVQGAPTAAQLRQAITSYYALMPSDTDAAWPRMTASYQTNHAGGRDAYQQFWDAIDRVTVSDVTGLPPGSAEATITYYFEDGRVVRERTGYGLVNDDGRLKINSTTVLSSVTL
jgi:serine/threonine protein kinase